MKIHIDTASAEEQAKASVKKQQGTGTPKKGTKPGQSGGKKGTSSGSGTPASGQAAPAQPKPVKPKPLPKMKKETKPPPDVADARARQTSVLKERGKREVQGKFKGPARDVDAGVGFGFQTYPFL
jgi:hypothetical protein